MNLINKPIFVVTETQKQILGSRIAGFNVCTNEIIDDNDDTTPKEHWFFKEDIE